MTLSHKLIISLNCEFWLLKSCMIYGSLLSSTDSPPTGTTILQCTWLSQFICLRVPETWRWGGINFINIKADQKELGMFLQDLATSRMANSSTIKYFGVWSSNTFLFSFLHHCWHHRIVSSSHSHVYSMAFGIYFSYIMSALEMSILVGCEPSSSSSQNSLITMPGNRKSRQHLLFTTSIPNLQERNNSFLTFMSC